MRRTARQPGRRRARTLTDFSASRRQAPSRFCRRLSDATVDDRDRSICRSSSGRAQSTARAPSSGLAGTGEPVNNAASPALLPPVVGSVPLARMSSRGDPPTAGQRGCEPGLGTRSANELTRRRGRRAIVPRTRPAVRRCPDASASRGQCAPARVDRPGARLGEPEQRTGRWPRISSASRVRSRRSRLETQGRTPQTPRGRRSARDGACTVNGAIAPTGRAGQAPPFATAITGTGDPTSTRSAQHGPARPRRRRRQRPALYLAASPRTAARSVSASAAAGASRVMRRRQPDRGEPDDGQRVCLRG